MVKAGALGLGPGLTAPGVAGTLLLDPGTVALFPLEILGGTSYAALDLLLPNQGSLIGVPIAFQAVVVDGGLVAFGGNAPVVTLN